MASDQKKYLKTPLWDNSLNMEKRLDYLMAAMTLEEKFQCLGTGCIEIERLGIRPFYVGGEGAHGVQARHDQTFDKGEPIPTTIFPNPIGMSASWDTQLIQESGCVVGNEARGIYSKKQSGGLCLWAPTVDMERDPRWGRTEEAYGEDPYLTGKMAAAYVRGLQGDHPFYLRCGATLKHFYANNVEEGRTYVSSSVDPRNKKEYYLEPYRRVAIEGKAEAIMTAYNEVNGTPCIVNPEVQEIAKEEWGIRHVVCDGGDMKQTVNSHRYFGSHSETIAAGLKAGIDCFTDDFVDVTAGAEEAYERGMIGINHIDRALRNHFGTMIRLGLFDAAGDNPYSKIGMDSLNTKQNQQIVREMTEESVVLLKNESKNQLLPLSKEELQQETLAVIGPLANEWYKDWYSGIPPYHVTPWDGIKNNVSEENLLLVPGNPTMRLRLEKGGYLGILEDGKSAGRVSEDKAEVFQVMLWDDCQATLRCSNGMLLTLEDGKDEAGNLQDNIVTASKEEAFGWFVKEAFHLYASKEKDLVCALEQGGELSLKGWNDIDLCIDEKNRLHTAQDGQEELILHAEVISGGIPDAVSAAGKADKVVVVLGANPMINCKEEIDRNDITMPAWQERLLRAVYRKNPSVILVLVTSIPFGITWEKEHIPAIVMTASGSMELGNALANVLFGKVSPAGRLNMTWYRDVSQLPDINDYDIIQKERTYQYFNGEVLYPFGHGLSYTSFSYENLRVALCDFTTLVVSLDVINQGERMSDEVVQIYAGKPDSAVKRAKRQLKAFSRIKNIQPGERRHTVFKIPTEDLTYYDVIQKRMLLEPGNYYIEAGASSGDIRMSEMVSLTGQDRGTRDGYTVTAADHYDRSANVLLTEGDKGYCCVASKKENECMELSYESVKLDSTPNYIVLDTDMEKGAILEAYAEGSLKARFEKRISGRESELVIEEGWAAGTGAGKSLHGQGFGCIKIPWDSTEQPQLDCSSTFTLSFRCYGKIGITNWYFE